MKKEVVYILVLLFVFFIGCDRGKVIGGERDEHGCLGAAGYTWCESKQKCLRTWEEGCSDSVEECVTDEDCVIGGCSGTVCQSRNSEPIRTICIYSPEYDCYKEINCGCVGGRCEWEKTYEFNQCVEEKRN